jgi:hypothetical protein
MGEPDAIRERYAFSRHTYSQCVALKLTYELINSKLFYLSGYTPPTYNKKPPRTTFCTHISLDFTTHQTIDGNYAEPPYIRVKMNIFQIANKTHTGNSL